MSYVRLNAMIGILILVVLGLIQLDTYAYNFLSETRVYMALYIGAVLSALLLGVDSKRRLNAAIDLGPAPAFAKGAGPQPVRH